MCFAPQRRALFRHLNLQKWSEPLVFLTFWLGNVLRATTACTFSTSEPPKMVRTWCVLYILTWKCASRHNGVHFFDIWTSKNGPYMVCFVHFDFEMCFAPQRRALFQHLNFQKRSGAEVFCIFSLRNWLRATTACNFSSLISPDVSAPAALASLLFHKSLETTVIRNFPTFSRTCIFFLLIFAPLTLLPADCFSSLHIVGSLTSKLPSITHCMPACNLYTTRSAPIYYHILPVSLSSTIDKLHQPPHPRIPQTTRGGGNHIHYLDTSY